jgi:5-methylcytosine-specific restriction endonuclease McrA
MSNAHGSKWIRPEKRLAIYHRDGFACAYCGHTSEQGAALSLDHVTPRELGGSHDAMNLVTSCVSCNSARQDLPLHDWLDTIADQGVDPRTLAKKIRTLTHTSLDMSEGKKLLAARKTACALT